MPRRGENIFKRKDGRWEARYVKEIMLDGRKKYGSVYAKSYKDVKDKRRECTSKSIAQTISSNLSVNEIMGEWLCESENRLKISSFQKYNSIFENHISKFIGTIPLKYLTGQIITQFTNRLLSEDCLSKETANLVLIVLEMGLDYAKERYGLHIPEVHLLKTTKTAIRVFSPEEQHILVNNLLSKNDVFSFGMLLALYTGLRIGELCALQWEDITDSNMIDPRMSPESMFSIVKKHHHQH